MGPYPVVPEAREIEKAHSFEGFGGEGWIGLDHAIISSRSLRKGPGKLWIAN